MVEIKYTQIVVYDHGVQNVINYKDIEEHFNDKFIKGLKFCPLECGKKISLQEIQNHYDSCENVLLQCPKAHCQKVVQRKDLHDHGCSGGYPCITKDGKHPELHRCKCFAVCELCLQVVEATKNIDENILNTECGLFCKSCDQVIVKIHPSFVGNDTVVACFDCKKIHAHKEKDCACKLVITDCAIFGNGCKNLEYIREGHDVD